MPAKNLPEMLTDPNLFAARAMEAARHIMRQPQHIRNPIADYGCCIHKRTAPGPHLLVNFLRAMIQSGINTWSYPLRHPDYLPHLDRFEDTVAHNVYLAQMAETIERVEEAS